MSRAGKNSKPASRTLDPAKRTSKQLTKEAALMETLHEAEIRQQQDFIKTRSRQLDEEIKTLRSQLKITDDSIESESLKTRASASTMHVSGFGLGRVEFNNDKYTENVAKMKVNVPQFHLDESKSSIQPKTVKDHLVIFLAKIKLKMEDVNMSDAELRELLLPSDLVVPDEYTIPIAELTGVLQTDLVMPVTKSDQMMILNTYGHGDGEVDVRRLLSDAGVWYDGPTSRDIVSPDRRRHPQEDFLGTGDLRYPYSPEHSPSHSRRYDDEHLGTGAFADTFSGSPGHTMSRSVLDRLDPLPTDYTRSQQRVDERYTVSSGVAGADKTAKILDLSERNLDDLHELHEMIANEKDFDFGHVPTERRRPFEHMQEETTHVKKEHAAPKVAARPAAEPVHNKENTSNLNASDSHEHLFATVPAKQQDAKSEEEQRVEEDRLSALARENERLKKEIGSFDSEFFEQLEDLKYRYSRLQEIVGEDPSAAGTKKGSALPLDRLSWSVRNSMTAMDRAGLTSPLVSRPRYPSAHTYAPGGSTRGGVATLHESIGAGSIGRSHIGGTLSASQQRRAGGSAEEIYGGLTRPMYESRTVDDFRGQGPNEFERDLADRQRPTARYPDTLSHAGAGGNTAGLSGIFGGSHGIGAGTHSFAPDEAGGSFSNLCERRLAFELSQHRAPEQATRSLIHRVMDAASRPGNIGFITCPQLAEVFQGVGLKLSGVEIELLATGFASNGKGGVDATEFCEAVKSLLYNLIGEHAARAAEVQARYNGSQEGKQREDDIEPLMIEICEGIITHDKRAVIGNSTNIFKTLLRPFVEQDTAGSGVMDFRTFHDVLKDIGVLLTHQDVLRVARHYNKPGERPESAYPTSNLNHIQSFRDNQLRGSLRGASKSRPVIGDWLATSGVGLESQEDYYGDRNGVVGGDVNNIDYTEFVTDLAEMLVKVLERDGGVVVGTRFPWILKEFEFVDALICQLEEMKPSQRRKVLMSLQYALSAADPKQECDLDGFTVLNALLSSGFRLQRVNRVRLLRAVEELGGKMDYRDLCQVLLNSCADWTAEEKHVVQKILRSMGVTVIERRNWLAKLRQSLMDASSKVARKTGRWFAAESGGTGGAESSGGGLGIPPSAFLHCLRDCGVVLNVEEEATLLDCLDTERLAKVGQIEAEKGSTAQGKESWSIPMIEYDTFLHYCNRHCGSWTDASPEIGEAVKWAMKSINNPVLAVHEFASLMHAFDETSAGHVSKRAFQICCHRSRLLANLPDESITSLSDILCVDGGGKVDYTQFIVYLRATCSHLDNDTTAPGIIDQLIANATDKKGTLLPLRNWLMRHTDMEAFILTPRDMNSLLREFSVMYRPEDLEELQMDIGKHVDANSLPLHSQRTLKGTMDAELSMRTSGAGQPQKKHVIDSRDLMLHILKARPRWTNAHSYLCKRILKAMQQAGTSMANGESLQHFESAYDTTGAGTAAGGNLSHFGTRHGKKSSGGPRGVETAIARRILSRLRAFAGRSAVSLGAMDHETRERDGDTLMVERDIFKHLTGVTGLPLTDEDVLVLADATDFLPEASRVRCDVILEALFGAAHGDLDDDDGGEGLTGRGGKPELTEACIFALDHLRNLLWKNAARLHRSTLEWVADVHTVFRGFDKTKTGFISSEDFAIALNLLNATISQDLLLDISYIPEGPGLIDYNEILDHVLIPPSRAPVAEPSAPAKKAAPVDSGKDTMQMRIKKKVVQKESPVQQLLNVVRKSLHHFIVSDHSLEQAWVCLLKVFQRFDPQETNQVSPRDFCLAVSVLLDGDDVVLTKSEWAEIIDHFASMSGGSATQKKQQTDFLGGAQVDYMLFCETVLDPSEIKSRLAESRSSDLQGTLNRSKQFLSKTTPLQRKATATPAGRAPASSSRSGAAASQTYGTSAFHGHVVGSAFGATTDSVRDVLSKPPRSLQKGQQGTGEPEVPSWKVKPSSASGTRGLHVDKDDEILKRFQEAPRRATVSISSTSTQRSSGGGAFGYNNAGAAAASYDGAYDRSNPNNANVAKSSASAKKSEWNTDELYRVARTQGQASRVSARGKSASLRGSPPRGSTGGAQPIRNMYAASHANRGSGTSRFNWDNSED